MTIKIYKRTIFLVEKDWFFSKLYFLNAEKNEFQWVPEEFDFEELGL